MAIFQSGANGGGTIVPLLWPSNAYANNLTALSLFAWANFSSFASPAGRQIILGKVDGLSGSSWAWAMSIVQTNSVFEFDSLNWSSGTGAWSWGGPSTGAFHAYGISYDGSSTSNVPKFYLDGIDQGTPVGSVAPSGSSLNESVHISIGDWNAPGSSAAFNGSIGHCAVWNTIVDPIEMALLGAGISPQLIRADALVFYCPCLGDPTQALDLGRARLGIASVTGAWRPADDPRGSLLPGRGDVPVAFSPLLQALPYRRPNLPLYRR